MKDMASNTQEIEAFVHEAHQKDAWPCSVSLLPGLQDEDKLAALDSIRKIDGVLKAVFTEASLYFPEQRVIAVYCEQQKYSDAVEKSLHVKNVDPKSHWIIY